ncbi:MAG: hypothetical protein H6623_08985 [Bdellovibrionaceae bacterium]|nr:hypothetical protein [Pseudobdellovibrionaceae bacterium]
MGRKKANVYNILLSARRNRGKKGTNLKSLKAESESKFAKLLKPFLEMAAEPENNAKRVSFVHQFYSEVVKWKVLTLPKYLEPRYETTKEALEKVNLLASLQSKFSNSLFKIQDVKALVQDIFSRGPGELEDGQSSAGEREIAYLNRIEYGIDTEVIQEHLWHFVGESNDKNLSLFIEFVFLPFMRIELYDFFGSSMVSYPIRVCSVCKTIFNANKCDRSVCSDKCQVSQKRESRMGCKKT